MRLQPFLPFLKASTGYALLFLEALCGCPQNQGVLSPPMMFTPRLTTETIRKDGPLYGCGMKKVSD